MSFSRWGLTVAAAIMTLVVIMSPAPPARAAQEVDSTLFKKIEANLMCTDGCGMNLAVCDNSTAQAMRQEIRQQLADGLSEQEIYAYMISIYGEEVMAAPPPDIPFNLVAWVAPFVALITGGLAVYISLDRWVFNQRRKAPPVRQEAAEFDLQDYEEVLQDEMKKYV